MSTCKAVVLLGKKDICKDCIKTDVCKHKADLDKVPIDGLYIETCEYFKDKSKSVELPCKVGDTVWCINEEDEDYTGFVFLGCNEKYAFIRGYVNGSSDVESICQYGYLQFLDWEGFIYCVPIDALYFSKEEAKQAVEKQIPKKPTYEGDGYDDKGNLIYDTAYCPNCDKEFEVYYYSGKCCNECGQVLDRSNE